MNYASDKSFYGASEYDKPEHFYKIEAFAMPAHQRPDFRHKQRLIQDLGAYFKLRI